MCLRARAHEHEHEICVGAVCVRTYTPPWPAGRERRVKMASFYVNFTIYRRDMQLEKNDRLRSCTPLATLETLGRKIITCTCSGKEIAGLKEEYYKFVNSRLTVFSCGELTAGMNLLGIMYS